MPKAVVIADRLGEVTDEGVVRHHKGAKVSLSQEDYDRHLKAGAIAPASSKEAKAAKADAADADALKEPIADASPFGDMTVAELNEAGAAHDDYPASANKAEKIAFLESAE